MRERWVGQGGKKGEGRSGEWREDRWGRGRGEGECRGRWMKEG